MRSSLTALYARALALGIVSLVALLGACAEDADPGGGSTVPDRGKADDPFATGEGASITFGADYTDSVSGVVRSGHAVLVHYDATRLPDCRGDLPGGVPGWTISAHASVDGGAETDVALAPTADGADAALEGVVPAIEPGRDLSLYFTVTNRWGCIAYDSDYGANYHFGIASEPVDAPLVHFTADHDVTQSGPIHAGDRLRVLYDLERLSDCRGTNAGYPGWSISGHWMADDGDEHFFEVSQVEGSDRVPVEAVIPVPNTRELAFWFDVTNRWGCHAWDSSYGANYTFPIESR